MADMTNSIINIACLGCEKVFKMKMNGKRLMHIPRYECVCYAKDLKFYGEVIKEPENKISCECGCEKLKML